MICTTFWQLARQSHPCASPLTPLGAKWDLWVSAGDTPPEQCGRGPSELGEGSQGSPDQLSTENGHTNGPKTPSQPASDASHPHSTQTKRWGKKSV
jgi:hypothetical protein